MCGIIAYSGHRPAVPLIMEGLKRLEYRGYDSAGVAYAQQNQIQIVRSEGKISGLECKLDHCSFFDATCGIGHTRWATHGIPVERNAHPHIGGNGSLALVHNGIIENYQGLKSMLQDQGYDFSSETDSEVLAHLVDLGLQDGNSVTRALGWALSQVEGSYAVAIINKKQPGWIVAARKDSPLLLGLGVGENFVASDIPAFLAYTREVVFLEDEELLEVTPDSWQVMQLGSLRPVSKEENHIPWDLQSAQKGGYKHFMLKEIMEQPRVIRDCLAGRVDQSELRVTLSELEDLSIPEQLKIVACGTSYHAGLIGQHLIESWAKIPVRVEIGSEFRYRNPLFKSADLVLAISQSGETADSLAGLRMAKQRETSVLGLCNVAGSSMARESDSVIYTQAGPEISVASTKAMCSQLVLLTLMAIYWGRKSNNLSRDEEKEAVSGLLELPRVLEESLEGMRNKAHSLAQQYSSARSFFFLGRGISFPLALEGALKLKEISYIHAEGYASGEMKHGPIALIDPDFPTFALALDDELLPKAVSNLVEVQARKGKIIALAHPGLDLSVDHLWEIPKVWGPLNTFLALPALQLFAYEMAVYLGKDVDQPRNLAKSVTVE